MPIFFIILTIVLILIIVRFVYTYFSMKKNYPTELFVEALRNENDGNNEAAVNNYENALKSFKTSKYHNNIKNITIKKLKVLNTIREDKNNLPFTKVD